jgi:hypothetical protein
MRYVALILLVALLPAAMFGQQKNSMTQQQQEQFKKEIEDFKNQLQGEIKALQDSLGKMSKQLAEQDESSKWKGRFFYPAVPPVPGQPGCNTPCDPNHSWEEGYYRFRMPELPELPDWSYKFEMPPLREIPPVPFMPGENFQLEAPGAHERWFRFYYPRDDYDWESTPPSDHYYKNHKHHNEDLLEMLPFYKFFKS